QRWVRHPGSICHIGYSLPILLFTSFLIALFTRMLDLSRLLRFGSKCSRLTNDLEGFMEPPSLPVGSGDMKQDEDTISISFHQKTYVLPNQDYADCAFLQKRPYANSRYKYSLHLRM
ncbi:MAG: hypothetical protein P8Z31_03700, partial [Gammaproteobacteria bacterium]